MKENNQNFFTCGLSDLEKILETWSEIKKQGVQLEQMGFPSDKSLMYGENIGSEFAKSEFFSDQKINDEKLVSPDKKLADDTSNTYLDSFYSSIAYYIKDNDIPHDKAEKILEVCNCCADLISSIGNNAILEGKNENYISAVASGHGIVAAFSIEKADEESTYTVEETKESIRNESDGEDEDGTQDPETDTGSSPSVDYGNVRTPEHTYHRDTAPEDEETKPKEEEIPKGISIKDLEKLAIFHQLHQAERKEKESIVAAFSIEKADEESTDIVEETKESIRNESDGEEDDGIDDLPEEDGTQDPETDTGSSPSVDYGNVRTPEHTYHRDTAPEDEETKPKEEEIPKGISIKDLEKLAIFHQLHQAERKEKESIFQQRMQGNSR